MEEKAKKRVAVVRVRGDVRIDQRVTYALKLLRLFKKNSCVVISNTSQCVGMLKKVKDYVTWGEIDEKTFGELLKKRARVAGDKLLDDAYLKAHAKTTTEEFAARFFSFAKELGDVPGLKKFFRLNPPRQGFERKGIKKPYSLGGALGYRGDAINDLLRRMM